MAKKEKQPVHKVQMTEGKRQIIQQLLQEYDIETAEDIREAHENGLIHFHDADYFAQHRYNCSLINLEDMLQNGTCISGTHIDRPHSFLTACTVTSQIVAQVASSQYGF